MIRQIVGVGQVSYGKNTDDQTVCKDFCTPG